MTLIPATCISATYSSLGKAAMKTMYSPEMTAGGVIVGTIFFACSVFAKQFWISPATRNPGLWATVPVLGEIMSFRTYLPYFESANNFDAIRAALFASFMPISGTILPVIISQVVTY